MRFAPLLIWIALLVVSAMVVGALFNFIPNLGYVVIPVAVLWFIWSLVKRQSKQRGDQNELDVLEETVRDYEQGRYTNAEYIKKQIFSIEHDHKVTPEVKRLLERARRAIGEET